MAGCLLMNESGGVTNHFWLLCAWKKEMLSGENYSLCSSYLTILQAKFHPTINMLAASWRSSQPRAHANSRQDPALGLEVMGPLPTLSVAAPEGPKSHSTRVPFPSSSGTGYLTNIASLADPGNTHQGLTSAPWSSHPLGHLLLNGFTPSQGCSSSQIS